MADTDRDGGGLWPDAAADAGAAAAGAADLPGKVDGGLMASRFRAWVVGAGGLPGGGCGGRTMPVVGGRRGLGERAV